MVNSELKNIEGIDAGYTSTPSYCGAEGDRTLGLVNAIHALSQLSYSPRRIFNQNVRKIAAIIKQFL